MGDYFDNRNIYGDTNHNILGGGTAETTKRELFFCPNFSTHTCDNCRGCYDRKDKIPCDAWMPVAPYKGAVLPCICTKSANLAGYEACKTCKSASLSYRRKFE